MLKKDHNYFFLLPVVEGILVLSVSNEKNSALVEYTEVQECNSKCKKAK